MTNSELLDGWKSFVILETLREKSGITIVMFKVSTFSPISDLQALNKSRPKEAKNTTAPEVLFRAKVCAYCSTSHLLQDRRIDSKPAVNRQPGYRRGTRIAASNHERHFKVGKTTTFRSETFR